MNLTLLFLIFRNIKNYYNVAQANNYLPQIYQNKNMQEIEKDVPYFFDIHGVIFVVFFTSNYTNPKHSIFFSLFSHKLEKEKLISHLFVEALKREDIGQRVGFDSIGDGSSDFYTFQLFQNPVMITGIQNNKTKLYFDFPLAVFEDVDFLFRKIKIGTEHHNVFLSQGEDHYQLYFQTYILFFEGHGDSESVFRTVGIVKHFAASLQFRAKEGKCYLVRALFSDHHFRESGQSRSEDVFALFDSVVRMSSSFTDGVRTKPKFSVKNVPVVSTAKMPKIEKLEKTGFVRSLVYSDDSEVSYDVELPMYALSNTTKAKKILLFLKYQAENENELAPVSLCDFEFDLTKDWRRTKEVVYRTKDFCFTLTKYVLKNEVLFSLGKFEDSFEHRFQTVSVDKNSKQSIEGVNYETEIDSVFNGAILLEHSENNFEELESPGKKLGKSVQIQVVLAFLFLVTLVFVLLLVGKNLKAKKKERYTKFKRT